MKKIFFAIMFVMLTVANTCSAKDIWLEHWQSENIDLYVMDDTITNGSSKTDKHFKVSTKFVRNGQLQQVVQWSFSKYITDMWRYETSTMDGSHTTVVIPRNALFEFCMDRLGWSYRIVEDHAIRHYY